MAGIDDLRNAINQRRQRANTQTGTDQFGNPINEFGAPLGQHGGGSGGIGYGHDPGSGNADMGFGDEFMGRNPFRPGMTWVTSPGMQAATMEADKMQAAGMDTGQADADRDLGLQARGQQGALGQALMDRAMGKAGPSVAELQMQRGIGMAQQAAARQAASARGINRGLASYGAMNAGANLAAQGVQDAAALRAQETIAAQQAAGKVFTDQRMQDLTSRGMSIQQAQAIMDAENRAREANMAAENAARGANQAATNDARKTSLQAGLSAAQGNQQAQTAQMGQVTQITEGEAQRAQGAIGGGIPVVGGLLGSISDINAKQDVRPLLYDQPKFLDARDDALEVATKDEADELLKNTKSAKRDALLDSALTGAGRGMQTGFGQGPRPGPQPYTPLPVVGMQQNPFRQPTYNTGAPAAAPAAPQGEESGGLGGALSKVGGALAMFSDKRAKTDAFVAGVEAALAGGSAGGQAMAKPTMGKAKPGSMPLFEVSPERTDRMGMLELKQAKERLDRRRALADAEELWRYRKMGVGLMDERLPQYGPPAPPPAAAPVPAPAPAPAPAPVTQLQPGATSDKRAKYSYSDERAKAAVYQQGQMDAAARMGSGASPIQPAPNRMGGLGGLGPMMGRGGAPGAQPGQMPMLRGAPASGSPGFGGGILGAMGGRPAGGGVGGQIGGVPGGGAGGFGGGLLGAMGGGAPRQPQPQGNMPALRGAGAPRPPPGGGMGGVLGGMGGMISDRRAKDLENENAALKSALSKVADSATPSGSASYPSPSQPDYDALDAADAARNANPPPPYQYRYKDKFAEKQGTDTEPRLGIMAQDALKSPMYRPAVVKMPDGMLGIDSNRLLHANTAMLSGEHERINQVEEQNRRLAEALQRMGDRKEAEILGEDEALGQALTRMGDRRSRELRDF